MLPFSREVQMAAASDRLARSVRLLLLLLQQMELQVRVVCHRRDTVYPLDMSSSGCWSSRLNDVLGTAR